MKRNKLFIRSDREPIMIDDGELEYIQGVLMNPSIKPDDTVSIGSWTGIRKDIKGVRPFKTDDDTPTRRERTYSDVELYEFQKELAPFLLKKGDGEYEEKVEKIILEIKGEAKPYWSKGLADKIILLRTRQLGDAEIRREAELLVDEFFVGRLSRKGENKYLVSKRAIRIDATGNIVVLKNPTDDSIPYNVLSKKLNDYYWYISRKDYAKKMEAQELDDLAESMTLPDEQ